MQSTADRISTFRAFEERFRKPRGYPAPPEPVRVAPHEVEAVERALSCRLPTTYRQFVTQVGPCEVRGLSDLWLFNNHADVPVPFESLWAPHAIQKQCGYEWFTPIPAEVSGGPPVASDAAWKYLLPFASDGGGNWHCFRRQSADVDDAPVYFFDHDGGEIERVAAGLEALIRLYLRLPAMP